MPALEFRSDRWSRRLAPWLEALAVAIFAAAMLQGFTNQLDLHPMDEAFYLSQGRSILAGDLRSVVLGWSPVSSLGYAALLLVPLGDLLLPDAMFWLTSVLNVVAAWWMLRAIVPPYAAVLGACWLAASPLLAPGGQALAQPSCYALTAALCFLALGFLQRNRHGAAFLLFGLAALNRGELAPWLLVAGGLVAWLGAPSSSPWTGDRGARVYGLLLCVLCLGILVLQFTDASCRARTWHAFRFSYEESWRGAPTDRLWTADQVTRDFPGAKTLTGALLVNPAAFARHVEVRLKELPGVLWGVVDSMRHLPLLARSIQLATFGLALAAILFMRQQLCVAARGVVPAVRCVLGAGVLTLAGILIMFANPVYVWPLWATFACAVIVPAAVACEPLRRRFEPAGGLRHAVPLLVIVAALLVPSPFLRLAGPHRELRESVHMLRRAELPAGACLWARFAPGLQALIGRHDLRCVDLVAFHNPGTTRLELEDALRASPPDYLLLANATTVELGARAEPLLRILAEPRSVVLDVSPGLTLSLYRCSP